MKLDEEFRKTLLQWLFVKIESLVKILKNQTIYLLIDVIKLTKEISSSIVYI